MAHRGRGTPRRFIDGSVAVVEYDSEAAETLPCDSLPWHDESGSIYLVFDGFLHNAPEVRSMLLRDGARLRAACDRELVLHAYERWGVNCASRLLGDFAMAIWDVRRRQLVCIRDRLGVKPFHYRDDGGAFVFGSEWQQVARDSPYRPVLNERILGQYLLDSCQDVEGTLYAGINRLPPAHILTVSRTGISRARYWTLEPRALTRCESDQDRAERLRGILEEAVRCRLPQAGRVGVLLSGGVDSSAVACIARQLRPSAADDPDGVHTFSLLFADPACDERTYLRAMPPMGPAHYFDVEGRDRAEMDFDEDDPHPQGPLYYPNLSMLRAPVRAAERLGMRTLLTGMGGDYLFAGYHHCADLLRSGRWSSLWQEVTSLGSVTSMSLRERALAFAVRPLVPNAMRRILPRRLPGWIRPDFARRAGLLDPPNRKDDGVTFPDAARQAIYDALFRSGALAFAFEEEDRFTSRASLDWRAPLLDVRLIEFALGLPPHERTWRGRTKIVLRNALVDVLPEPVRERSSKADFSGFMDRELRVRQRTRIDALFTRSRLAEAGVVDGAAVQARWSKYCEEGGGDRWMLLMLLNLERAVRAFQG